ncbi:superoxide dismutase [Clostridium saccharobutylicum]|nr:superoxide dismutase [Clostridium saccharobutylicum]
MKYDKIELPYSYNALEPYIDEETIRIHYTKHLQAYVDKLNKALEGYEKFTNGKTLEEILSNISKIPKSIRQTVINQGEEWQIITYTFQFFHLTPKNILKASC